MHIAILLSLQTVGMIGPPAPLAPRPVRDTPAAPRCAPSAEGDIVVCAARNASERFRLQPLPPAPTRTPPKAEFGIAGAVRGAVRADSEAMANGEVSKRAMIDLKLPF